MLKRRQWMFLFLFLILFGVTMVYAAESETDEEEFEYTMARTDGEETKEVEREQIRMANEDAILAAAIQKGRYLSEKEYGILTRIVEAEATAKDSKSKILVANVVLNRMDHEDFPDTVEKVVFQKVGKAVQFSPVADGRYYKVKVTEETKECVDRALMGEDYSEGALYFMERSLADRENVSWFDRALTKLFEYEGHEFYR